MNLVTTGATVNLQATLSASSACGAVSEVRPHHPISCAGALAFYDDGTFACEHAAAPPGDPRTRYCLDHSVALLLIELIVAPPPPPGPTPPPGPG